MAFYRVSGTPNVQPLPGAASTALTANAIVNIASGTLALAASSTSSPIGLCLETRASTDADYATARPVLVDMVGEDDLLYCDNVTGTLTTGMVGQFLKLSSTAGVVADAGTATDTPGAALILLCIGFISATQGYFILSGSRTSRPAE